MNCVFEQIGDDVWKCKLCGVVLVSPTEPMCNCRAFALGDSFEEVLQTLGITQERWLALKALVQDDPKCNCEARKQWLNQTSAALQMKVEQVRAVLRKWYERPR